METSARIASTRKRSEKIGLLAALLSEAHDDEIEIAVAFLSGAIRQSRLGIGYSTLGSVDAEPAPLPNLTLIDVDQALTEVQQIAGARI